MDHQVPRMTRIHYYLQLLPDHVLHDQDLTSDVMKTIVFFFDQIHFLASEAEEL